MFGGETIADGKRAKLLRESDILPAYYFPKEDVRTDLLVPSPNKSECPTKVKLRIGRFKSVSAAPKTRLGLTKTASTRRARKTILPSNGPKWINGWKKTRSFSSTRVILLSASTRCRARAMYASSSTARRWPKRAGRTSSSRPITPLRYYIPQEDVRMEMLVPSATTSRCPYKGPASYWSVKISGETFSDLVWGYMAPIAENPKIKGLLCFFHERGCDIYVDGELCRSRKPNGRIR